MYISLWDRLEFNELEDVLERAWEGECLKLQQKYQRNVCADLEILETFRNKFELKVRHERAGIRSEGNIRCG